MFCVTVVPIIYLFWPVMRIKIAVILTDRIGEFTSRVGYLASLPKSPSRFPSTKIVVFGKPAANAHLKSYFVDRLVFVENSIFVLMANICDRLMTITSIKIYTPPSYNNYTWFNDHYGMLKLTDQDIDRGYQELKKFGIGKNDWFVGFHARDSSYLNKLYPESDFSYHDFRDCSVQNYVKAAEHIAGLGGYAFRLGAVVNKPLVDNSNTRIIDYAVESRSEFLDVFLCAKSRFVLANSTGLYAVSTIGGVPVAAANAIPFTYCPLTKNDVFIPKILRWTESGETLSFDEALELGLNKVSRAEEYIEAGVKVIENTSDEIFDLCVEMLEQLDGFSAPESGKILQEEFKRRYLSDCNNYQNAANISYKFLERHPSLLEINEKNSKISAIHSYKGS